MFSYFCIFIYLFAIFLTIYNSNASKKIYLILSFISLFFFSSFRDISMGADAGNYLLAFNTIRQTGTYYMEKGYVLFNRLIGIISDNFTVMIMAISFLLYAPLYKYIKDNVEPKYWPTCLFVVFLQPYIFLQTTFNVMRQACSVGVLLTGMILYRKHEKDIKCILLFSILAIAAAQFHRFSYIALVIPFLQFVNWSAKKWRIALFISVICNLVDVSGIVRFFAQIAGYNKYFNYSASLLNNPIYLFVVIVYIIIITDKYEILKKKAKSKLILDLYIFSLIFLVFAVSNDMIYRVYIMFAILSIPAIPVVLDEISVFRIALGNRKYNGLSLLLMGYYCLFFFGYIWYLSRAGNAAYIPYRFCF